MLKDIKIRNHNILRKLLYLFWGVKDSKRGLSQCDRNFLDLYLAGIARYSTKSMQFPSLYYNNKHPGFTQKLPGTSIYLSSSFAQCGVAIDGETFTETILAQDISLASWGTTQKYNIGSTSSRDLRTYKCVQSSRMRIPGKSVTLPGGRNHLSYTNTRCHASKNTECTPYCGRQGVKCTPNTSETLRAGRTCYSPQIVLTQRSKAITHSNRIPHILWISKFY